MILHGATGPTSLSAADIADLIARIPGPVPLPGHDGYRAECATFNLGTPLRPAVAVGATSVADVQSAVRFAAEHGLPVAVLTTGHQVARSAEGAVLINMSRLNTVHVVPARRLARVGGGTRMGGVVEAAGRHGLAPIVSTTPSLGVVGFNLGGGLSPLLGRRYGYAADHVQAVEIVTADGELRRVTATREPDLFWALRGGKGNFGVVTALEFRLFPVDRFYGGGLFFGPEHAETVLHAWRTWVTALPRKMTSSVAFRRRPSRPFLLHVRFSSLGSRGEAERLLAPLRAVAPTVEDTITERSHRGIATLHLDPTRPITLIQRGAALRDFPAEAADALLAVAGPDSATRLGFLELRALGGALAHSPAVPNAVAGRTARWAVVASNGGEPDSAALRDQLGQLGKALAPWAQNERQANLLLPGQDTTQETIRAAYGRERYDRLAAIKRRYDPNNLFRMNHNITPA